MDEVMDYQDEEQNETFECNVCGKPIEHEGICSSRVCFKVDNE